jgi:Rod binding domain-containing protein
MQPVAAATPAAETLKSRKAGRDFEALLLGKVLESARPRAEGAQAEYRAMADRRLAETLAASSPLGVAKMLEARK